jgi:hypothetical protein
MGHIRDGSYRRRVIQEKGHTGDGSYRNCVVHKMGHMQEVRTQHSQEEPTLLHPALSTLLHPALSTLLHPTPSTLLHPALSTLLHPTLSTLQHPAPCYTQHSAPCNTLTLWWVRDFLVLGHVDAPPSSSSVSESSIGRSPRPRVPDATWKPQTDVFRQFKVNGISEIEMNISCIVNCKGWVKYFLMVHLFMCKCVLYYEAVVH